MIQDYVVSKLEFSMPPILDIKELHYIIENNLVTSVFQPIVDIKQNRLYGYEALSRGPKESHLFSPLQLFNTACESNRLSELEYACRDAACKSYSEYEPEGKLFINVSPISLMEKGYEEGMTHWLLSHYNISPEKVVIELSEQYPLNDYKALKKAFQHFREEGFEVALDDLGAGYAGLKTWSELRPDYVKIDRHFIDSINKDPIKREFVRSIHEIALELNCQVIAEGIETAEELALLYSLGIRYAQGYYLGRPCTPPESENTIIGRIQTTQYRNHATSRPSQTVAELSCKYPIIKPDWTLNRVIDFFHSHKSLRCLPVIYNGKPVGIIERQAVLELITAQYGRELHGKKLVSEFMNRSAIIVDHNSPLENVSHLLTTTHNDHLQQDFIITRNDCYMGIGKTAALLQKITEQKIRYARYANPLTQLPGNVPIYEHIDQLIAEKTPFTVAYCDLNHFKYK
mgnify:CR=1 FL=1